jgi:hypothetical protein
VFHGFTFANEEMIHLNESVEIWICLLLHREDDVAGENILAFGEIRSREARQTSSSRTGLRAP